MERDDDDSALPPEEEDIDFTSPHAITFLASFPLTRQAQKALDAMINAYESRTDPALLEAIADDEHDPSRTSRHAPIDIVYGFGCIIRAATLERRDDILTIARDVKEFKGKLSEVSERGILDFDVFEPGFRVE
ncbi:hypothetical protein V8E36_003358 [Tilletia maclaganii]